MEKLIKYTLDNMTQQQLESVWESDIDPECSVGLNARKRIKERTYALLDLERVKKTKRKKFSLRLIVCACFTVLIFAGSVVLFREPLMNMLNISIGESSPILHHQGGNSTETKYDIKEKIDFSKVDKIVIISGITGQKKTVYDVQPIINEVKKIVAHSPVNAHDYSVFDYSMVFWDGEDEIINLSIVKDGNGGIVMWGIFEETGESISLCKYVSEGNMSNLLLHLDEFFE